MLRLPRAVLADVLAHAREGMPNEVCGILAGRREPTAAVAMRSYRVVNVHPRPRGEFMLDPQEQLRVTLHVEDDLKEEVLGFYHSHPVGPPRLSATDAARATKSAWPGVSYFLVWWPGDAREGYASAVWDAEGARFVPEETSLEEAPFVVDPAHSKIHRRDAMTPECQGEIDWSRAQDAEDVLKASMVLKTRHYMPCSRCWSPS